jgi:glycosyltransferase involved in cell wall biosynthesis
MRLLICTQAVDQNDPVLGFFCRWIEEFATRCEHIHVICLNEGKHTLPANVSVHSLGKESGRSRVKYLARFFRYSWSLHGEYDAVFVHMNEQYVLLGGVLWRILGKQIALWRNHKMGSWRTRCALSLASVVFHTSPQAFVVYSPKAIKMPIGIDTNLFSPGSAPMKNSILFLGRLDPVKKPELFLGAMQQLADTHPETRADVYGHPTPGRETFAEELKKKFGALPNVAFHGAIANYMTPALYRSHAVYVNTTPSGSFDKTIGEAMAAGCIVVIANDALRKVVPDSCIVDPSSVASVAAGIRAALEMPHAESESLTHMQRNYIVREHSLSQTIERIVAHF